MKIRGTGGYGNNSNINYMSRIDDSSLCFWRRTKTHLDNYNALSRVDAHSAISGYCNTILVVSTNHPGAKATAHFLAGVLRILLTLASGAHQRASTR